MSNLSWLNYFNEDVTEVIIQVGEKPRKKKANASTVGNIINDYASNEVTTRGDFFYELTKVLKEKEHWKQFFTNHGINFNITNSNAKYRVLAVGYEGKVKDVPVVSIRRLSA